MNLLNFLVFSISVLFWYFFATLLQWYAYKLDRVLFKFHKRQWLFAYFILPYFVLILGFVLKYEFLFSSIVLSYLLISIYLWQSRLDKKLVFTGRVKRFLAIFIGINLGLIFFYNSLVIAPIISLLLSHVVSVLLQQKMSKEYEQRAIKKLNSLENMRVVAITASYGKTSIKNFLAQILSSKFSIYATPRSVNTKLGILKDINEDLPDNTQIYIVEAGARSRGDILEITELVAPHIAIIGKIGPAHIEYFKSLENIASTKSELIKSKRLKKAFAYENVKNLDSNGVVYFGFEDGLKITNVKSTLDGLSFCLDINGQSELFHANVLGSFNVINITAAILASLEFGMSLEEIRERVSKLNQIEHRLQRIDAGGKVILDDSFNGNVDGMSEAISLCSTYNGKKVIVTPGLVEASLEDNEKIANMINNVFDLVILTGSLNIDLYDRLITEPKKIVLQDKSSLVALLASDTAPGDLIYFANDAPSYI